jgi:peptide/nickel transport system ATP-binding protein
MIELAKPDVPGRSETVASPLLQVDGLEIDLLASGDRKRVVDGVSFDIQPGEIVGLVGESGCGKSVTALAIMGLLPSADVRATTLDFDGQQLLGLRPRELNRLRGNRLAMVFQDPMTSLNPSYTVGEQIAESLRRHEGLSRRAAWKQSVHMLDRVHIAAPHRRARQYPHSLSGGMRQRAMIAMALACGPQLLIADEPTTALDVTVQAGILALIIELRETMGLSVLLITHDLGVVAETCDRALVMYSGEVVEQSSVRELYDRPNHPYTEALMRSMPQQQVKGDGDLVYIPGSVPQSIDAISGCRFHNRCRYADPTLCATEPIALTSVDNREVRCVRASALRLEGTAL